MATTSSLSNTFEVHAADNCDAGFDLYEYRVREVTSKITVLTQNVQIQVTTVFKGIDVSTLKQS